MPVRSLALLPALSAVVVATALAGLIIAAVCAAPRGVVASPNEAQPQRLDPAGWGSDHVGQELPDYMESGECLFCHRLQVGVTWGSNKHNRTIREPEADAPSLAALRADPATRSLADDVKLILGDTRAQRFLRRSQAYGRAELLTVAAAFGRGRRPKLISKENPRWDDKTFNESCAGCHTTAVDPQTHAFVAVSLDCFTCHGAAPAEHANDPKLMPLAKARQDSPAVVTAICASCHVRFGKSKASGLPYPTNFVAGDNLFRDFQVDWSKADDTGLNPADRHVMQNVRDVALFARESTTCLTCHDVHASSTKKHRELPVVESCRLCHDSSSPIKGSTVYEVHSERCQY